MNQRIKITDLRDPRLDIYARLSEVQLLRYAEPAPGIFIGSLKYAVATQTNGKAEYTVNSWGAEKDATIMKTDKNGNIVVKGLDDSTSEMTYEFKETKAPEGYSINETNADVTWDKDGEGLNAETRTGAAAMTDTKLNTLPSTGGIGTTIFTIGGCAIMIVAAGLFFATRRKTQK